MRKLTLNPDELLVDSFETARPSAAMGTVRGAQELDQAEHDAAIITSPREPVPLTGTCQSFCGQLTCGASCGATCATCYDPTCNSCNVTQCWTGASPECCA